MQLTTFFWPLTCNSSANWKNSMPPSVKRVYNSNFSDSTEQKEKQAVRYRELCLTNCTKRSNLSGKKNITLKTLNTLRHFWSCGQQMSWHFCLIHVNVLKTLQPLIFPHQIEALVCYIYNIFWFILFNHFIEAILYLQWIFWAENDDESVLLWQLSD